MNATAQVFETREDWLAARQKNIGGSEIAALFGCQADYQQSHYALWCVKAGKIPAPEVTGDRPKWGLKLEASIAEAVGEEKNWTVEKGGYVVHPKVAGLACTLDYAATGNLDAPHGMADPGCLELKNADWLQHRRAWVNEPPLHIQLQLQHQLCATGYSWGAVACLVGGNTLEIYEYTRREKVIREIERKVAAFWQSVAAAKEPPVDGSDTTADALKALFPTAQRPDPIDLTADNAMPDLCATFIANRNIRLQAEKEEKAAMNGLRAKLADFPAAFCVGYRVNAADVAGIEDTIITEEMLGRVIKGRSGYRKITVKEVV